MSIIDLVKEMGDWIGVTERADEATDKEILTGARTVSEANEIIRDLARRISDLLPEVERLRDENHRLRMNPR